MSRFLENLKSSVNSDASQGSPRTRLSEGAGLLGYAAVLNLLVMLSLNWCFVRNLDGIMEHACKPKRHSPGSMFPSTGRASRHSRQWAIYRLSSRPDYRCACLGPFRVLQGLTRGPDREAAEVRWWSGRGTGGPP